MFLPAESPAAGGGCESESVVLVVHQEVAADVRPNLVIVCREVEPELVLVRVIVRV